MPLLRCMAAGVAGAVALAAMLWTLDRAFPPPLERLSDLSVTISDSGGTPLRSFINASGQWRLPTRVDDVPPAYLDMLIAFEDRRFHHHPGVDPLALLRASWQAAASGRIVSGGSTLTMQVARLLEPKPRTLGAKAIEIARALQLEWRFDKAEILSMYLTLAPFGGNIDGVRAAALAFFGKQPQAMDLAEMALLVALPQNPNALSPDRHAERARAARDKVLERAVAAGLIEPRLAEEARAETVPRARLDMPFDAPHLAARLRGRGEADQRTTLRADLQRAIQALAARELPRLHRNAGLAILVVENKSRQVLAYLGAPEFFDAARSGQIDMVRAARSPGSTLKPFVYGYGFEDRLIHPETIVADVPRRFGDYAPLNFDRQFRGDVTIATALQQSLNIPAVAVLSEVGALRVVEGLKAAGAGLRLPPSTERPGLPIALGGVAIDLWDLVTLYAGLANGGVVRPLRVTATAGDDGRALFAPATAATLTSILRETPAPPGRARGLSAQADGRIGGIAVKTGTSYGFRDAWAIGYSERHTVGIWSGRPDGTPIPDAYGRNTAAPILFRIFDLLPNDGVPGGGYERVAGDRARPASLVRLSSGEEGAKEPTPMGGTERLQLVFPLPGTTLTSEPDGGFAPVGLRAAGGRRPLTWLIDGRPLPAPGYRRDALWQPGGPGFARVTVIDAEGTSESAEIRLR